MTDYTSWHTGMEVVCVETGWTGGWHYRNRIPFPLVKGRVYVISGIMPAQGVYESEARAPISITLDGVEKVLAPDKHPGFNAARFRPVQKRKTSIACFEKLLQTKSVKELVQ